MKIEFLLAEEDGTWRTEIVEAPFDCKSTDLIGMVDWANINLAPQSQYRKVVLFAVYQAPAEEKE